MIDVNLRCHRAVRSVRCPKDGCFAGISVACRQTGRWLHGVPQGRGSLMEYEHGEREYEAAHMNPQIFKELGIEWYLHEILARRKPANRT
jgi:hypothetical protein